MQTGEDSGRSTPVSIRNVAPAGIAAGEAVPPPTGGLAVEQPIPRNNLLWDAQFDGIRVVGAPPDPTQFGGRPGAVLPTLGRQLTRRPEPDRLVNAGVHIPLDRQASAEPQDLEGQVDPLLEDLINYSDDIDSDASTLSLPDEVLPNPGLVSLQNGQAAESPAASIRQSHNQSIVSERRQRTADWAALSRPSSAEMPVTGLRSLNFGAANPAAQQRRINVSPARSEDAPVTGLPTANIPMAHSPMSLVSQPTGTDNPWISPRLNVTDIYQQRPAAGVVTAPTASGLFDVNNLLPQHQVNMSTMQMLTPIDF